MRQLKFRQPIYHRDGSFREWHYWGLFESDGEWVNIAPASRHYMVDAKITDPFDSTQFAGLTDKNGVEIYEGDIVESKILRDFTGDEKIKGRVLFDDLKGMWVVEEINPVYAEREYLFELVAPKWPERTEVIGNIYEHKNQPA